MVGADYGWAVGDSWRIHWNGTSWNRFNAYLYATGDYSVCMVDANDGWVVGGLGMITRWNGSQWVYVDSSTMYFFYSVFMTSADDGWAVGGPGTLIEEGYSTTVLHWDGIKWTYVGGPTEQILRSVFMVDSSDGWAVGDFGTIIRWNGVAWVVPELSVVVYTVFLPSLTLIAVAMKKRQRGA